MRLPDPVAEGARVMTVCNACRYCEQYCPVFPAMERRLTFGRTDLAYLANLCHNCGECLYACQYAAPHEFAINVPRTLAELRLASYEAYCWPAPLGTAFRRHGVASALGLAAGLALTMTLAVVMLDPAAWTRPGTTGAFYAVVPHAVLVTLFGGVALFAVTALGIGVRAFWVDIRALTSVTQRGRAPDTERTQRGPSLRARGRALRDVLTLRNLHRDGVDCTDAEEDRQPWRRWCHHATFYGFLLCFLSTSVAALYHTAFGWQAPHAYTSVPVLLGAVGGGGLVVGPLGLLLLRQRRDPTLTDPAHAGLDVSFLVVLLATSTTGLALLALRHTSVMPALLVIHLGTVLALFVTLPYGKFVHGFYRAAALLVSASEDELDRH